MKTLLLMSVVWVTFALPAVAAVSPHPRRALRWVLVGFSLFTMLYYFWVAYGHTRFFVPRA